MESWLVIQLEFGKTAVCATCVEKHPINICVTLPRKEERKVWRVLQTEKETLHF